ncbi:hypothetical protein BN1058_02205 [Paraliobacillus sp. PM-2]|uniref:hypothetical protein n=1 Tax=Paraliobacillus sp. PM-2 TaxID=1462524 RepID=UPI00061BC252|nr:hypothetical protein [Paraliobacillus sp. PM-2]CQR47873.1 hypothetical protein BN1058_02205 [Paraliobacillus sp. PM-2]
MRAIICMSFFIFLMSIQSVSAFEVDIGQSTNHLWEKKYEEMIDTKLYEHQFKSWHHFIQKTNTCKVTKKVKVTVNYCKIHEHYTTEITHLDIMHSKRHN